MGSGKNQPNGADRRAAGKAARDVAPLDSHQVFEPARDRDPVGLILKQAETRVPELIPIRHGRMLVSPFTFFRGAALPMAADLSTTPSPQLSVQLCGDAHLANFGAFASPERRLVFDLNDFDETLPGPFEWDVKRFAASVAIAGRDNGFTAKQRRRTVLSGIGAYRESMRTFARSSELEVWYARLDVEEELKRVDSQVDNVRLERTRKALAKARTRDSRQALRKLTRVVDGRNRIISNPPLIVPIEELLDHLAAEELEAGMRDLLTSYAKTLESDRRYLLSRFTMTHAARKVVGVGSVGTRVWILLLEASDGREPLFLQAKEAQVSVLSDYVGRSRLRNQGQRVVAGQRLMQASSDIFLGWQHTTGLDGVERDFYLRQLRDWKFSFAIEQFNPAGMALYARICGWTLARAHARTGDRIAIASYLGKSDRFENAIADFSELYADQTERDHAALAAAVAEGRAEASS